METQDIFIAKPNSLEQVNALKAFMKALKIKFEITESDIYNPEFVAKIKQSKEQYYKGDYISVEEKDLKSYLELEAS